MTMCSMCRRFHEPYDPQAIQTPRGKEFRRQETERQLSERGVALSGREHGLSGAEVIPIMGGTGGYIVECEMAR